MVRIENDKIVGTVTVARQFLANTKDQNGYQVKVVFDGTDVNLLVKHALNDGIIVKRKSVKTRQQAEALAEGISFTDLVSAQPKDPDTIAAGLDVDAMSDESVAKLLAKLKSRPMKNLQTGEDIK